MSNLTSVTVTSGLPTSGTGTVSTLDNLPNLVLQSKLTDGTNTAAVKAANTAAVAADPAMVVAISPNSVNANGQAVMANSAPVVLASNQSALPLAVKNNLWFAGTSNNGLLASVLTLQSTELNSLGSGSVVVSSVGGSSGLFTNGNLAQAQLGEIFFTLGTVTTMSAGANLAGWFLTSPDGTTFEPTGAAPARAPDFIVPLPATTGAATYKAAGLVPLPALNFKVLVQNNSGQTFTSTGNTLKVAPIANQY